MSSGIPDNPFLIQTEVFPEDFEQLLIKLTQMYQNISLRTNLREISNYTFEENPNGQLFPGTNPQLQRNGYRKVITVPALTPGATSIAHGIPFQTPNTLRFTDIWGVIEDLTAQDYQAVPNSDIHLEVTGANVVITIPGSYNGYTGRIYLDYTQTD